MYTANALGSLSVSTCGLGSGKSTVYVMFNAHPVNFTATCMDDRNILYYKI